MEENVPDDLIKVPELMSDKSRKKLTAQISSPGLCEIRNSLSVSKDIS